MMIETSRPTLPSLRELFAAATDRLGHFPLALLQLMARLAVAAVFWNSGQTKIASWDTTVALFAEEYRVPLLPPEIAAYLATTAELTCPVLLLFGFGARFGAVALLGMTLVIQTFVYPENWIEHLTWATLLMLILTRGAGFPSLDHLIARAFAISER
jgi:putative oxidoreductase